MKNKSPRISSHKVLPSIIALQLGACFCAAVDFQTTVSNETSWQSNVFKTADEESDLVNYLEAVVDAKHHEGLIMAEGQIFGGLRRYADLTDENSEDYGIDGSLSFPSVEDSYPYHFSFGAGYARRSYADAEASEIIEVDTTDLRFSSSYDLLPTYGISFDATFIDNEYNLDTTSDFNTLELTFGGYYDYSEKLSFKAGYTYATTDVDASAAVVDSSSKTHTFFVGAEGDLFARSQGHIIVGITNREFDQSTLGSDTGFYSDIGFRWDGSKLWSVDLALLNFFDNGVNNQSRLNSTGIVRVNITPDQKLGWGGSVFASNISYEGDSLGPADSDDRDDQEYGASAYIDYSFTSNFSASFELTYKDRESDFAAFDYDETEAAIELIYVF